MLFRLARCLLIGLCCANSIGSASAQAVSEAQLKASYLVSFFKYIEWPGNPESLSLCLLGREELSDYLRSYEGRIVSGKALHIRKVTTPDEFATCQQVFIPESEPDKYLQWLPMLEKLHILTVSDKPGFVRQGGAIGLAYQSGKVSFEINAEVVGRNGLKVATPMLRLARQVVGGAK